MTEQEREIFATAHNDYDIAFSRLFALYCHDVYRAALSAAFFSTTVAEDVTAEIFTTAYKYLHTFTPQRSSFRLYLFSLIAKQLQHRDERIPPTAEQLPKKLRHHFRPEQLQVWSAIEHLPMQQWLVIELWYGAKLTTSELSLVLERSLGEVQQLQKQASSALHTAMPNFLEQIEGYYERRNAFATLSNTQQTRLLRSLLERKRLRLTFVRQTFWDRLLQPSTVLTVLTLAIVSSGLVLAVILREPLRQLVTDQTTPTQSVSELFGTVITERRPSFLFSAGELPEVEVTRTSLTELAESLYGTNYVVERTNEPDVDGLQPTVTIHLVAEDYIPVESAYTYTVPEALSEDQLQYAALRHFSSLPLNQFTYVNGTYYVEDDPTEFRPLFISFNNNGSIDFQMRQAAICQLKNLTDAIADTQAQTLGYEFLQSHKFVDTNEADLRIERVSSEGRSVAKDAFCGDGDETAVQDRLMVYYPPHTLLKFGDGTDDQLPLRIRGMAVQLHGQTVTNLRIDPLYLLLQHASKGSTVQLKPLSQAITELQAYTYPSASNTSVFPQWNHSYGVDRLKVTDVTAVRLEYVYDELNHTIEPYYVFSGLGTDGNDKTTEVRWYVVASTTQLDLRAPYRE